MLNKINQVCLVLILGLLLSMAPLTSARLWDTEQCDRCGLPPITTPAPTTTTTAAPLTVKLSIFTPTNAPRGHEEFHLYLDNYQNKKRYTYHRDAQSQSLFDGCWNANRANLLTETPTMDYPEMWLFVCVFKVFPANLTLIPVGPFSYARQRMRDTYINLGPLIEPQYYEVLLKPVPIKGPYRFMAQDLINLYTQDQQQKLETGQLIKRLPANSELAKRLRALPTMMGHHCWTRFAVQFTFDDDRFEPYLELTWYCRRFMLCLHSYLVQVVTTTAIISDDQEVSAHQQAFYQCAKKGFTDAKLFPFNRTEEMRLGMEQLHRPHLGSRINTRYPGNIPGKKRLF